MFDLDVETDRPMNDFMRNNDWTEQQIVDFENEIRKLLPEAKDEPIIFRSLLPSTSSLSGTVHEDQVEFTKIYHGDIHYQYLIGEHYLDGEPEPSPPIEYLGTLAKTQDVIVGNWIIRTSQYRDGSDAPEASGHFELRRRSQ
jgi:hypothetical protein